MNLLSCALWWVRSWWHRAIWRTMHRLGIPGDERRRHGAGWAEAIARFKWTQGRRGVSPCLATEQDAAQAILTFARESLGLREVPELIVFPDGDGWGWYFAGDGTTTSYVTPDGGIDWLGNQPAERCNCPDCRAAQGLHPLPAGGLPPACEVEP